MPGLIYFQAPRKKLRNRINIYINGTCKIKCNFLPLRIGNL